MLFYNGDGCPNFVAPKHVDPSVGPGYDYDVCNSEIILTLLAVKDGRIVLPDGMSYRLLVLPERSDMPLEVLAKLKELVAAGLTLVGPKPAQDPGLQDYPKRDQQVKALADELWGRDEATGKIDRKVGKGRVAFGIPVREILAGMGVKPDFTVTNNQPNAFLDWIHRSVDGTEIYFIANRNNRDEKTTCTFRVSGKIPELWDPVTAEVRTLSEYKVTEEGLTEVPLQFASWQSAFVVFREQEKATKPAPADKNCPETKPVMELGGAWEVAFDPKWGGAEKVTFEKLVDWTARPEEGIRFYSGKATYRKVFDFTDLRSPTSDLSSHRLYLDLGDVNSLAEVRLNGTPVGLVWTKPYRIDIGKAIKAGANTIEIDVVNLWPNRLIGDGKLPAEKRYTQTNIDGFYQGEHKLLPSGLLGPVSIQAVVKAGE